MEKELLKPIVRGAFSIERRFWAPRAAVFAAWADPAVKARWFIGPETWTALHRKNDFRVGGEEVLRGRFEGGVESVYTARYHVIVPDRRLVYAYDMHIDGAHLSVSLASVEFADSAAGTKMTFTEQGAYFDGEDEAEARQRGVSAHFDLLVAEL